MFVRVGAEGHTATIQPDGSVRFLNGEGQVTGGIATPWAVDAKGQEVSTRFLLEGNSLIQIVEHEGATYPVIADPLWFAVIVTVVLIYTPRVAIAGAAVYNTCARIQCGPMISTAVRKVNCHVRNRSGC